METPQSPKTADTDMGVLMERILSNMEQIRSQLQDLTGRVIQVEQQNEEISRTQHNQVATTQTTGELDHPTGLTSAEDLENQEANSQSAQTGSPTNVSADRSHQNEMIPPQPGLAGGLRTSIPAHHDTPANGIVEPFPRPPPPPTQEQSFTSPSNRVDHTYVLNHLRRNLNDLSRSSIPPLVTGSDANPLHHSTLAPPHPAFTPNRGVVELMEYDGNFSWRDYRTHLECVSLVNGWCEQETAMNLVAKLRGPALHFVTALGADPWNHPSQLVNLLENQFSPRRTEQTALNELRRRTQRTAERLDTFGLEVERLTRAAYPGWPPQCVNQLALEQYLNGITDGEVQLATRSSNPTTVAEACRAGQQFLDHRAATRAAQRVLRTSVATLDPEGPPTPTIDSDTNTKLATKSGNDNRSA